MSAPRIQSLNRHTTQIDLELFGIKRVGAAYLLRGERSCLVDSGTPGEVKGLIRALDSIDAFPPDLILLTHSHWDHSQGVPGLCRAARKRGKTIQVMASEKALPNLRDQSWNRVFDAKHSYADIPGAVGLRDGETLDLGSGLVLEILDVSGHCADDIAIYDRANKTLFAGDALGYRVESTLSFPPFMPPFWDRRGFDAAVERVKAVDYEAICLAHYGCLRGDEARRYPEEARATVDAWWDVFAEADRAGKLGDILYIRDHLIGELDLSLPDLEVTKPHMRALLKVVNTVNRVLRKPPVTVADEQMKAIIGWLTDGYRGQAARS
jgi:glyoxylase-like metal-dependent hydrolase (beta-lactamase superfamily II)